MKRGVLRQYLRNPLSWLLALVPLAIGMAYVGAEPPLVLLTAAGAMVPLAGLIGEATEALAAHSGPRVGGLLNATLGNAAELIISVVAIREGLLELVKASITGSILGNLLVVLGASMVVGGLRHGVQSFDRRKASSDSLLLVLAVVALAIPSLFTQFGGGIHSEPQVEALSLGVAGLMIVLYALALVEGLRRRPGPLSRPSAESVVHMPGWPVGTALAVLGGATLGVVWLSEILVRAVEPVIDQVGVSEFFLGVILVPLVGNVAEHLVAVRVAAKNHMTLSVEIAVGSSLQVALFVAPALVFLSLLLGHPLSLVFNSFELIALVGGVIISALVASDGEANWLEGAELLAVYLMLGLAFFLLPA